MAKQPRPYKKQRKPAPSPKGPVDPEARTASFRDFPTGAYTLEGVPAKAVAKLEPAKPAGSKRVQSKPAHAQPLPDPHLADLIDPFADGSEAIQRAATVVASAPAGSPIACLQCGGWQWGW